MALTSNEQMKKAFILLDEAAVCIDLALTDHPGVTTRPFPLPETRVHLRQLLRLSRDIENNWRYVWRQPW